MLGKDHREYALSCNNLGGLYSDMGEYAKVELLYLEAQQTYEKVLGNKHPSYGKSCNNLADFYRLTNQRLLAEKEYEASFAVKAFNVFKVFRFTNEKEKAAY